MIPFLKLIYLPRQAASISGSFPEENEYFLSVCFEQTRMQWGKKKKDNCCVSAYLSVGNDDA